MSTPDTRDPRSPIHLPRSSGILLHITSLPGSFGIGDLGPDAYRFADFLQETGQRIWQVLPLVPVGLGNSPYSSPSTFAVNPLFVSPELLVKDGLIDGEVSAIDSDGDVDFPRVYEMKHALLRRAFDLFLAGTSSAEPDDFEAFCAQNDHWLDDYALFIALKRRHDGAQWTRWPAEYASRDRSALEAFRESHPEEVQSVKFNQYVVWGQWERLKRYCNDREISFFGDLPIYVAHDSADVWANPGLFFLDENGRSTVVAGVPPDYFSETGQRWGNPIYRWDVMKENGYSWWTRRFEAVFKMSDLVRLDHFRGFAGYWEIPAEEETAVNGRWVDGPGADLFKSVERQLGPLPVVAEDLGLITPDVKKLMGVFGFPGMAVLQFAFGEDADHPFLPHSYDRNLVAYTGTHDNDTFLGWYEHLSNDPDEARTRAFASMFLGFDAQANDEAVWSAIRAVSASAADYVVFPMQDVLGLGSEARMNTPGRAGGNWAWRFSWSELDGRMRERLRRLTAVYGRSDDLDDVMDIHD